MAQGFAIAVRLIDLAAGPIGKINQAIAGIAKAVQGANSVAAKSVSSTSVAAKGAANTAAASARGAAKSGGGALYLIKDGLKDITRQTKEIGEGFLKAFTPIEALGLGGGIGGAIAAAGFLTQNFASAGASILRMSQSLGVNVIDLQTWRGAADLAGVGADAMTNSLQGVSHAIYMARNGLNPEAFRAAQQFGINLNKGATDAQRAQNVLLQVADKIRNDPTLKGNVQAQQTLLSILGIDPKMLPLLQQGRVAIEQYIAEAKKHGYLNQQQVAEATALQRAYSGLTLSVENTGLAIGAYLSQWLTPLINSWSDWLDKLRQTPTLLGSVKKGFEDLTKTDWAKVAADIVHALLGDGTAWQTTGSRMVDFLTKGFNSAVPDFSQFVAKMTPIFAGIAKSVGQAFADDIGKAITDAIKNHPYLQELIKIFEFPGKAHDYLFGPSTPDEDLRNRPAPGSWGEFFHNLNPFANWSTGGATGAGSGKSGPVPRNNPGNIRAPGGGFMQYNSIEEGMAALKQNLLAYEDRHALNTLGGIINRWSPPSENPTAQLIENAARRTGFGPNQPIDLHDPAVMEKVANAIVVQEQGPGRAKRIEQELAAASPKPIGATPPAAGTPIPIAPLPAFVLPTFGLTAPPPAALPTKPVGAPNVKTAPGGEMVLPDVNVTAPAPPDMRGKVVPIPPRVPSDVPGRQSGLDRDSLHHFILDIRGANSGVKYAMNRAEGPATTDVRVQYSLDNLS